VKDKKCNSSAADYEDAQDRQYCAHPESAIQFLFKGERRVNKQKTHHKDQRRHQRNEDRQPIVMHSRRHSEWRANVKK
jgi:hypothetical protein